MVIIARETFSDLSLGTRIFIGLKLSSTTEEKGWTQSKVRMKNFGKWRKDYFQKDSFLDRKGTKRKNSQFLNKN